MKGNAPVAIAILFIVIGASVGGYLYVSGAFSTYSAGVTSCTDYTDVITGNPSHSCSSLQVLNLAPQSVIANGQTLYDTNPSSPTYGKSNPLTKDARITLAVGNAPISSIAGTFTCSALVDGKTVGTLMTNTTTLTSVPSGMKVCSISIDGKTLQTQYYNPTISTHIVSMTFAGKVTYVYPTGATQTRSFSGSLGNITITITAPPTTTTSSSTYSSTQTQTSTSSTITASNEKIPISGGGGSTVYSSSQTVSAPAASLTTNPTDYTKQATQIIQQTNSYTTPTQVQVNGQTLNVPSGQVGSASYVPNGSGGGTVTVTVTNADVQTYQRGATQVENQFGGYSNMTPYAKCQFLSQC